MYWPVSIPWAFFKLFIVVACMISEMILYLKQIGGVGEKVKNVNTF